MEHVDLLRFSFLELYSGKEIVINESTLGGEGELNLRENIRISNSVVYDFVKIKIETESLGPTVYLYNTTMISLVPGSVIAGFSPRSLNVEQCRIRYRFIANPHCVVP